MTIWRRSNTLSLSTPAPNDSGPPAGPNTMVPAGHEQVEEHQVLVSSGGCSRFYSLVLPACLQSALPRLDDKDHCMVDLSEDHASPRGGRQVQPPVGRSRGGRLECMRLGRSHHGPRRGASGFHPEVGCVSAPVASGASPADGMVQTVTVLHVWSSVHASSLVPVHRVNGSVVGGTSLCGNYSGSELGWSPITAPVRRYKGEWIVAEVRSHVSAWGPDLVTCEGSCWGLCCLRDRQYGRPAGVVVAQLEGHGDLDLPLSFDLDLPFPLVGGGADLKAPFDHPSGPWTCPWMLLGGRASFGNVHSHTSFLAGIRHLLIPAICFATPFHNLIPPQKRLQIVAACLTSLSEPKQKQAEADFRAAHASSTVPSREEAAMATDQKRRKRTKCASKFQRGKVPNHLSQKMACHFG